ncbi:MAG: M18 family aminopeptidase [Clostridiales bacterium]|nr:M18 family aminopeptidase [Clostridiales bacterium]
MNLQNFLENSYTAYHAVQNCERYLQENGFIKLISSAPWDLKKGGKYYIKKSDSAIIAFVVGDLSSYEFNIAVSHVDSPALRVKGNTLIDSPQGKRINVEKYGGGLWYSMLDIPLKVCGRIIVHKDGKLIPQIITSDYNVNIPSLAIHHNPGVNEKLSISVQTDMLPLLGGAENLYSTLTQEEVIDADLFVVPALSCTYSGAKNEFITSPRIDNLTSVYASITALSKSEPHGVAVVACFDNEEIGSTTKQSAQSAFLPTLLKRVNDVLGFSKDDYSKAIANGFALSIDNAHGVHPAHPEKSDPAQKIYLNKGIVIKHHLNYATDAFSSAVVKTIANKNGLPWQDYYNNSDVRCGGTIGLITSTQLQINVCDIGIAQLAMHSAIETVGRDDIPHIQNLLTAYFNCSIKIDENCEATVN